MSNKELVRTLRIAAEEQRTNLPLYMLLIMAAERLKAA